MSLPLGRRHRAPACFLLVFLYVPRGAAGQHPAWALAMQFFVLFVESLQIDTLRTNGGSMLQRAGQLRLMLSSLIQTNLDGLDGELRPKHAESWDCLLACGLVQQGRRPRRSPQGSNTTGLTWRCEVDGGEVGDWAYLHACVALETKTFLKH